MHKRLNLLILLVTQVVLGYSLPSSAIPTQGSQMMAAGPSPTLIEAVQDISGAGGNVVDAAVSAALTLAVTAPYYAALGGGGFSLIKMGGEVQALDFREVAPLATDPHFYKDRSKTSSTHGGAAVGVPGVPAGLWALHQKYGKLPWKRLFKVPLRMAMEGFRVSGEWAQETKDELNNFNSAGKKFLSGKGGAALRAGEILKQSALAKALVLLRDNGEKGFYSGAVAEDIVKSVKDTDGVMSLKDLSSYKVRWLTPLETKFADYQIYLMPPPSSGGVVIKTSLKLVEMLEVNKRKPLSVEELHLLGEVLSRSFRGRAMLGDPDFTKNPIETLTSDKYLNDLARSIKVSKTSQLEPLKENFKESSETTHFSIMDKNGNAVAFTVTLNGGYGSRVVSEKFGIALNNEMDDFTTRPGEPNQFGLIQGSGNFVEPGKRPLSSMSPTIITKKGKTVATLGAPGGPRIISSVFQTMYRFLANGFDIDESIQAGRVHHQFLPNTLFVEERRLTPETLMGLKKLGHKIENGRVGKVYGVTLGEDGVLDAAFDSRGEGAAGGI